MQQDPGRYGLVCGWDLLRNGQFSLLNLLVPPGQGDAWCHRSCQIAIAILG